jgi:P-type Cu+ transporter
VANQPELASVRFSPPYDRCPKTYPTRKRCYLIDLPILKRPEAKTELSEVASKPGSVRLRITGMTCTGCAAGIQRAIEARADVKAASVSFASGTAEIEGRDLKPESLIATVQGRGFQAELIESDDDTLDQSDIERQQHANERTWRVRAAVGMGLWIPLETLHWTATALHWHGQWMPWVMFAGSLFIIVFAGFEFYKSAWKAAVRGTTNMDTLISIGATTAFVYSTIVHLAGLELPTYFAEASGLLGIVSLGHWFEARASAKAGSSVRELMLMQPETAEVMDLDGSTKSIPSVEVQRGWKLVVRPGGRIAVDGIVIEGESAVDQSIVTGESMPVGKRLGDTVVAGSMNTTGRLLIETTVDGRHTTISRIAKLVQRAQTSRAPIQKLADQVSAVFVPTVLAIAAVTLVGWWLVGDFSKGLISAVTVLIISCPCALGLATPMAVMVGTGSASQRGILIRNAEALERIGRAHRIVFDKTGTLTAGKPEVTSICPIAGYSENSLLAIAASVEASSEHPIGKAIVAAAKLRGLTLSSVERFESIPGQGVKGELSGQKVAVERDLQATARVVLDGQCIGTLTLNDRLRSDAVSAIKDLQRAEVRVSMLTGDRQVNAQAIATELGLDMKDVFCEATPESKAAHIASLGKDVIMVGDGLNDAAALATSGLGVALASGTNVAMEAAAVVIPGDRVGAIPELVNLSRATLRTIKQNLFFAFLYNSLAIPLAALGLLGESGPLWAAFAMGASDITVVGNALWLKRKLSKQAGSSLGFE